MYDLIGKIDEGSQSVVYEAIEKKTNQKYAVKVIKKKDQDIISNLKTQFRILKNLDHPNVVKAYNLFIDEKIGIHHLVLELCDSPNLRFHMLKNHILK
jgi:calcium-dependent protein kinase